MSTETGSPESIDTIPAAGRSASRPGRFALYRELSKSGIVALVLISVLGGYLAGQTFEQPLDWVRLFATLIGVLLVASGSSALNHWQDREMDARMPRTARRPIPSGRITTGHVLGFSFTTMAVGLAVLSFVSWELVVLGALAIVSYNGLYTLWWKRTMPFAAVPGAIPGALPILMGYVAATGEVFAPGGIYLFFILFFWQMPHFWVLALRFTEDYAKGGVPTLPVARGSGITINQIVLWCLAYCALALGAPLFFRVGALYLAIALVTVAVLLWELRGFARAGEKIADTGSKLWLRYFLGVNFSLIAFVGGIVVDLWSIHLIRHIKG
jgi:protoheme IX farnesyltransferase